MLLKVEGIHTYYGFSYILQGISLEINEGEAVALLGRNGAGKTTTLRSIIGVTPPRSGKIFFQGTDIAGLAPYKIVRKGIAIIPDTRRIIPNITVRDNLKLAMLKNKIKGEEKSLLEMAYGYFPRLRERADNLGAALSGGEQQMLAIGRALVTNPEIILLDEPSEGLSPVAIDRVIEICHALMNANIAILLVEQNIHVASALAQRTYIILSGRTVHESAAHEFLENTELRQKYLGI